VGRNTAPAADPRLRPECIERVARPNGRLTLVGVVHDHPASSYRVQALLESAQPAVLALELPPLAVPLARQQAADERTPPTLGGEMSAAVQAADTDRVVGIDGPSVRFCRRLAGALYRDSAPSSTVRAALRSVRSVTRSALAARVGATLTALTPLTVAVDVPTAYDTTDDPDQQADDERERIRRAESILGAFSPPPASAIRKRTRERHMADRLADLDGSVVAVVGMAHLEAVASHLREGE